MKSQAPSIAISATDPSAHLFIRMYVATHRWPRNPVVIADDLILRRRTSD